MRSSSRFTLFKYQSVSTDLNCYKITASARQSKTLITNHIDIRVDFLGQTSLAEKWETN